jgi:hypothetical protein
MSFSNPLWNDMIIQQLLNIDNKLTDMNTRLDNMSKRLEYIEKYIFNNKDELKEVSNDIIHNNISNNNQDICDDDDDSYDNAGEWMKVNKRYHKKRF